MAPSKGSRRRARQAKDATDAAPCSGQDSVRPVDRRVQNCASTGKPTPPPVLRESAPACEEVLVSALANTSDEDEGNASSDDDKRIASKVKAAGIAFDLEKEFPALSVAVCEDDDGFETVEAASKKGKKSKASMKRPAQLATPLMVLDGGSPLLFALWLTAELCMPTISHCITCLQMTGCHQSKANSRLDSWYLFESIEPFRTMLSKQRWPSLTRM
eukprot:TRINITY_DN104829_c0_g1_i1.p1 TRINITY_DN104829_c0_g1~~TRINITY_DN104829_c0_g1_i1.p1  ORF type:complete len:225 (-),score=42.42 TRINITY_DN104829_c0_g1_i1:270-917(-)